MGRITVVGLGPAGPELVTAETLAVIAAHDRRFVRTARHPSAEVVSDAVAFDHVYETEQSVLAADETIANRLIEASGDGDLLYAVPGSPLVLEPTVERLRTAGDSKPVELNIRPALSFLELAWVRLGIDPMEKCVGLIDGERFAAEAASRVGPLLVANWRRGHGLAPVESGPGDGRRVVVLQSLGLAAEAVFEVSWDDLKDSVDTDHLTSIYVPGQAGPASAELARFDELVRVLRQRCPWDRQQTHASLRRHLLSEVHETLEALDARAGHSDSEIMDEIDDLLEEELGDLLFQIVFHARLATERGAFTLAGVARRVHDKLVARHPHVFGDVEATDTESVLANWEAIKRVEKNRSSAMDGLPGSLPALLWALGVQKRAASAGLAPAADELELACTDISDALVRLRAAGNGSDGEAELGALLFSAVQVARRLSHDPEAALRAAVRSFEQRFRGMEDLARAGGLDLASVPDQQRVELWRRCGPSARVTRTGRGPVILPGTLTDARG